MLVLTRYPNQRIKINVGQIEIVVNVVEVRGDKVRLGVTAPKEVVIEREELKKRNTK